MVPRFVSSNPLSSLRWWEDTFGREYDRCRVVNWDTVPDLDCLVSCVLELRNKTGQLIGNGKRIKKNKKKQNTIPEKYQTETRNQKKTKKKQNTIPEKYETKNRKPEKNQKKTRKKPEKNQKKTRKKQKKQEKHYRIAFITIYIRPFY